MVHSPSPADAGCETAWCCKAGWLNVEGSSPNQRHSENVTDFSCVASLMEDSEVCMGRKRVRRAICVCAHVCTCLTDGEIKTKRIRLMSRPPGERELVTVRKEGGLLHARSCKERSEGHWPAVSRQEKQASGKMRQDTKGAGVHCDIFEIQKRRGSDNQMMVFSSTGVCLGSSVPGNFDSGADQL